MKIRNGHAGPIRSAGDITGESPVDFTGKWIKPLYVCSFIYLFIYLLSILSFGHQLNYLHLSHPIKYHKLLVQDFFLQPVRNHDRKHNPATSEMFFMYRTVFASRFPCC